MPTFTPDQLAAWTGGRWSARPAAPLTGFTMDTRQLRAGQVFVALRTEKRDGHEFLPAAQAAGASAALVATPNPALALPQLVVADPLAAFQAIAREHRRTFRGPVIGISGSAGKTSTKNLLALLLGGEGAGVLATEGNLNNHIGVPLTLTQLDPARHKFAVIEAGISAPGEMKVLAGMIEPTVALITLVAAAHTAELGGLEGVAREKAVLPAAVRPDGVAIFPKACTHFAPFRDMFVNQLVLERSDVLRPATQPRHTIHFNILQRGGETVIVIAYGPPPPAMFKLARVSDGMAQNAALALTAALYLGMAPAVLQARLAGWAPAAAPVGFKNGRANSSASAATSRQRRRRRMMVRRRLMACWPAQASTRNLNGGNAMRRGRARVSQWMNSGNPTAANPASIKGLVKVQFIVHFPGRGSSSAKTRRDHPKFSPDTSRSRAPGSWP